jgi:hypothetical protein
MRVLTCFPAVLLGLGIIGNSATLHAGSASIGVVLSGIGVLLNNHTTAGNATIFEANSIETLDATCRIQLAAGGWAIFGERSSGHVFHQQVELQTGSVRVSGYDALAAGLKIHAVEKAVGTISMRDGMVEVASIAGVLQVVNASGATVLNVRSGQTFNLQPRGVPAAVFPASDAHGIPATVAHEQNERCISADRDCRHRHDPGDDGHGHGNDDHGGDHGRGH